MKTKIAIASGLFLILLLAFPVKAQVYTSPRPSPAALSAASLRSCQSRETAVKQRMLSLTNLASTMENVFQSIAMKVEDFYMNKIVPSGKTLSNYDALVADISAKKGIIDMDLSSAADRVNMFSCTADDPRGLLTNFRIDMQKVKTDLKNYRTSIKNLIVAVRLLSPTPQPGPTATP